jgi:CDP-glucose 4,6-dehydratase
VAPYDVSKACTDLISRSYGQHFGLPVTVTRCGNLYGPGDANQNRLVPGVIRALRQGEAPVLRSRGLMSREWLYVEDAARANLLLLDQAPTGAFNVGGGATATALEVTLALIELSGLDLLPEVASEDPRGEIPHQSLDCSQLASLGWCAETTLAEGLRRTWDAE